MSTTIPRAERKARGEEKIVKYAADILCTAAELVEKKVNQYDFHVEIMTRRSLLEKAIPQEKQLIAMAFARIGDRLMTMESTLKVGPPPKPAAEKKSHRNPSSHPGKPGPSQSRRKNPYPEPLSGSR